jgi:PPOX class probable F420-dependent enzyme
MVAPNTHTKDSRFQTLSTEARRFLGPPRFGVVACLNPDGSPIQAVIWYLVDGDTIVFNSRVGRHWPANLLRDPRVSLTVVDGYDYVDLRGEVEIDDDPELGQAVIAALAHRYLPDAEAAAASIAGFAQQRRVTFRLRPAKVFERLSRG